MRRLIPGVPAIAVFGGALETLRRLNSRSFLTIPVALGAALIVAGCGGEQATEPELLTGPQFDRARSAACPTAADFVVTDEAELFAALDAAVSGQVIAIDGMIEITEVEVYIETPGITVTCATGGSGVFSTFTGGGAALFTTDADAVAIEHLVIDGTGTFTPFFAGFGAEGVRISHNTITCGNVLCVYLVNGAIGTVIEDNSFDASTAFSAVQVQGLSHGTIIRRNTIRADQAGPYGIRVTVSDDAVVSHNTLYGPWGQAAIIIVERTLQGVVRGSRATVESNRMFDAGEVGIDVTGTDHVLRGNRVTGADLFAITISGCSNVLVGNNTVSADNGGGVLFHESSGANSLAGNDNVVDDGAFDCDGDGVNDPNIITGSGAVEHGANLGELVSDGISAIPTHGRPELR